jgi:hypothetical protein
MAICPGFLRAGQMAEQSLFFFHTEETYAPQVVLVSGQMVAHLVVVAPLYLFVNII